MHEWFSGPPLVMGSVNVLRGFHLQRDGQLDAVSAHYLWKPGVNIAGCGMSSGRRFPTPEEIANSKSLYRWDPHRVASRHCECGFYGYFQKWSWVPRAWISSSRVQGIVKCYGLVTIGSKGVRAEKAEIQALIVKRRTFVDNLLLRDGFLHWLGIFFCMIHILIPVAIAVSLSFVSTFFFVWAGWVGGGMGGRICIRYLSGQMGASRVEMDRIRANYPGIPIYRQRLVAQHKHKVDRRPRHV